MRRTPSTNTLFEDLLDGKRPHIPWIDPSVFKKAKREKSETQDELDL